MDIQNEIVNSRLTRVRELQTQVDELKRENRRLRDETAALAAHFDLALLAALDLAALPPEGKLIVVDGWNLVLGAHREAASREELLARCQAHLEDHPRDFVWIVYDGHDERVQTGSGRLRVSYTGGGGEHRADRFICDFLRMAAYRGDLARIEVRTRDRDFLKAVEAIRKLNRGESKMPRR